MGFVDNFKLNIIYYKVNIEINNKWLSSIINLFKPNI